MSDQTDLTPTEKGAVVTREFMRGAVLTPRDVAELTECSVGHSYKILNQLSRVLPLYEDEGRWVLLSDYVSLNID
jgi:hypothetical protein